MSLLLKSKHTVVYYLFYWIETTIPGVNESVRQDTPSTAIDISKSGIVKWCGGRRLFVSFTLSTNSGLTGNYSVLEFLNRIPCISLNFWISMTILDQIVILKNITPWFFQSHLLYSISFSNNLIFRFFIVLSRTFDISKSDIGECYGRRRVFVYFTIFCHFRFHRK